MKKAFNRNDGFTLVELIVAMAMAVIVTAAATSVLLLGLRVNRQTVDTANQQITVQALLDVLEDTAADGRIKQILTDYAEETEEGERTKYGSWKVIDTQDKEIFSYDADNQTIYTNGTPVLEGVYASNAILEGQLLSISVETKTGTFTSTIYCRTAESADAPDIDTLPGDTTNPETNLRAKFIDILKKEYRSRGEIKNGEYAGQYYSQWYCGGSYDPGWNERTPWCACFVSWALNEMGDAVTQPSDRWDETDDGQPYNKWFANVDDFMEYFNPTPTPSDTWLPGGGTPQPGDLIFFDWNKGKNPQHVGVVLKVDGAMVYTIEGNSAGRVTVRSYTLSDPRIIGYGVVFAA